MPARAAASGDLLVFLNPDATPAPGFVDAIRAPRGAWSAWQGLVTADGGSAVNTSGGVVHFTGIAWAGQAAAAGPREVAFLSGACLAIPRAEWERLGGFGDAFFMYQEDVDLSLRLRLAGGRLGVEPAAVVDHDYEFAKGPAKWRRLEANRWATIVRCYPGSLLLLLAPALAATEVGAAGDRRGRRLAAAEAAGDRRHAARAAPAAARAARGPGHAHDRDRAAFARWLTPDLDSPYLGRAGRSAPLRWALRAYWRVVLAALR